MQTSSVAAQLPVVRARGSSACRVRAIAQPPGQQGTATSAQTAQTVTYGGTEFVVDENPVLKSTWQQRGVVVGGATASALLLSQGVVNCSNPLVAAVAALAGFIFADFGSGVYHWGVDNYGSAKTPLVGSQIAAFQGHHQRPWTITQREFCNNVSLTFKPAGSAAVLLLLLSLTGVTNPAWDVFAATAIFFIAMSQQFHAWSHMKKSQLPAPIVALQDAGMIVGRQEHGTHHKSPFNVNYCIVSGWCNSVLDAGLMLRAEQAIHKLTSVEPRGWSEPEAGWRELEPPPSMQ